MKASDNFKQIRIVEIPECFYFKVTAASRYLGISPNTLRRYTDLGLIKARRLPGGDRIYKRSWLDQFVEELPDATETLEKKVSH